MPPEWIAPPRHPLMTDSGFGEALNLDLLGDAIYCDGKDREADGHAIPVLSHPFYHSVLYTEQLHGWSNQAMEQKSIAIRHNIERGNFLHIVWLYERPYRANYLHTLWRWKQGHDWEHPPGWLDQWDDLIEPLYDGFMAQFDADQAPFWRKCREAWTDNENIHQENFHI